MGDQKASCDLAETSRSGIVPLLLVELITYYIWRDILQGECILSQQKIVKNRLHIKKTTHSNFNLSYILSTSCPVVSNLCELFL